MEETEPTGISYKCNRCLSFFEEKFLTKEGKCPVCGSDPIKNCRCDHLCHCPTTHTEGLHFCKECGQPVCGCGSHDVLVLSRVTGYMQDLEGFNAAKKQEVKDRHRYVL